MTISTQELLAEVLAGPGWFERLTLTRADSEILAAADQTVKDGYLDCRSTTLERAFLTPLGVGAATIADIHTNHQHAYLSTACMHRQCELCRLTCKYCQAPCTCACHTEQP